MEIFPKISQKIPTDQPDFKGLFAHEIGVWFCCGLTEDWPERGRGESQLASCPFCIQTKSVMRVRYHVVPMIVTPGQGPRVTNVVCGYIDI